MRNNMNKVSILSLAISMVLSTSVVAKVPASEAAKLSSELTPLGLIKFVSGFLEFYYR